MTLLLAGKQQQYLFSLSRCSPRVCFRNNSTHGPHHNPRKPTKFKQNKLVAIETIGGENKVVNYRTGSSLFDSFQKTHEKNHHHNLFAHLLPKHFPKSVSEDYFPYTKWNITGSILSATSGVLATQSLLFAIGLGSGAIPVAAALNWVIKDGLGQLGSVIFASYVSRRFDSDPKRWNFLSTLALNGASLIEILTPLFPALFLPLASIANLGKNLSFLGVSATRTTFHWSFALENNLADIAAKTTAQTIAGSLIGTGCGVLLSALIGASFTPVLLSFIPLASLHLFCNYKSLKEVAVSTLGFNRLEKLSYEFVTTGSINYTPFSMRQVEPFILKCKSPFHVPFQLGASLDQIASSPNDLDQMRAKYQHQNYLVSTFENSSKQAHSSSHISVSLLLFHGTTSQHALRAFLHAAFLRNIFETTTFPISCEEREKLIETSSLLTDNNVNAFLTQLKDAGWVTDHLFLEVERKRLKIVTED